MSLWSTVARNNGNPVPVSLRAAYIVHEYGEIRGVQLYLFQECKQLQEQLETISYAGVVATRPHQQQDAPLGPPGPPTFGNTLFCTIDTSRAGEEHEEQAQIANIRQQIEKEMRGSEETKNWRCAAMIKDPKSADRVKVICRNEDEIQQVKEAAQKTTDRASTQLSSQNTQLGKNRRNPAKAPGPPGPRGWSAHMRTSDIVTPSGSSAGSILITPRDPHSAFAAATSSGVASGRRAARAVVAEIPRRRER